jgi:biopolymer transport protein ExbD
MSGGGGGAPAPDEGGFGEKNVFGEQATPDVELNLTALMDILSNLLFFLLASFGATIIMAINTTVPTQSADKSDVADTPQSVTLNVSLSKTKVDISATGQQQSEAELAAFRKSIAYVGELPDFAAISEHLYAIKQKYPRSDTMILTPESGIQYHLLIKTMDAAREMYVKVDGKSTLVALFPTVVLSTIVK